MADEFGRSWSRPTRSTTESCTDERAVRRIGARMTEKRMSRQSQGGRPRRDRLRQSLERDRPGGFTTHGARLMARPLGGEPAECTLICHCRTFVFEYPRSELVTGETVEPTVVFVNGGFRVAIVCDLRGYFESSPADSQQFNIDVSLRAAVQSAHKRLQSQHKRESSPLFLVIEEFSEFTPTVLSRDQCFTIDEVRDGEAMIEGGREGKRAILAFRALGCPWPDFQPEMYHVNVALAAVKAVHNVAGHIAQLHGCSCFVTDKQEAVYTLNPTMSARAVVVSPVTTQELEQRATRIGTMLRNMMSESEPAMAELFDSMVLDKTTDDGYLRLTYLRLWQAVEDARKHLGRPGLLNERQVIAGNRVPTDLKEYRNAIAHWHTGRIDHSFLSDLEYTTMELLRRKYGGSAQL